LFSRGVVKKENLLKKWANRKIGQVGNQLLRMASRSPATAGTEGCQRMFQRKEDRDGEKKSEGTAAKKLEESIRCGIKSKKLQKTVNSNASRRAKKMPS